MEIAKIEVSRADARRIYCGTLTSGMVGVEVSFSFDASWDGLVRLATFKAGGTQKDVALKTDRAEIPHEVLAKPCSRLEVGVYGTDADGALVIPTVWADLGNVIRGAEPSGETTKKPTPEVWVQILGMIGDIGKLDTESKESLVAAINEVLHKGTDLEEVQKIVQEYLDENLDVDAKDGFSPIATVTQTDTGAVISITDANGTTEAFIENRNKYILTEADRQDIAQRAAGLVEEGDVLENKAAKPLIIYADNAPNTGANSASGIPIFTIDYSPSDLKEYADAGGSVTIVRYNRHYLMYEVTETAARFRFIEASDVQVDWYNAVLDENKNVTITKTTHKSRLETTTGGAVGQVPIIKGLNSKGLPTTWEFVDLPKESSEYPGCYYCTVDGETEWLNPPAVLGVEYRTAERWLGKPVYTKLLEVGYAANGKAVAHGAGSVGILRCAGLLSNIPLPINQNSNYYAYLDVSWNNVTLYEAGYDNSYVVAQLWYIK